MNDVGTTAGEFEASEVWGAASQRPSGRDGSAAFARLSRDSAIFAVGSVAGKLVALITLPVFTRLMEPEAYGRLDLLSTLGSAAISLLSLGMDVAAIRLVVDPKRNAEERKRTLGAWSLLAALVAAATAVALLVVPAAISTGLFGDAAHRDAVVTLALIIGAGILQIQGLTLLRIQGRPIAYSAIVTATLVLNAALGIALLVFWARDERAPLVALGISWAVGAVAAAVIASRGSIGRPRSADVAELLRLALPLVPALASTWVAEFGNRAILLGSGGAAELGYFSIGIRIASIGGLVVVGFQLAWQPRALSLDTTPEALRRLASEAYQILTICSVVVAFVGLAAPEIVRFWSGPAFAPSLAVTGVCLVGAICSASVLVATLPSLIQKRPMDLTVAGLAGAAVAMGLNVMAAPRFGAEGTAASIAVGQALIAVLAWQRGTRSLGIPVVWRRSAGILSASATIAILSTAPAGGAPLWLRAVIGMVVLALVVRSTTFRHGMRAVRAAS